MPLEKRTVEASLKRKGFEQDNGDHAFFAYYNTSGQKTSVFTKTSHGSGHKTISDTLVGLMAKQCGLTAAQFRDLVNCPLSRDKFEAILIKSGRIKP